MKILAVTSWGTACGIANYAEQMIEAGGQADPSLEFLPQPEALDPTACHRDGSDVLWLNYHRGLHSRWTPQVVAECGRTMRVVITFHDTYGEREPDALTKELHDLADAFIVHEPCEGLPKAIYLRQGVPAWAFPIHAPVPNTYRQWDWQPVLGTAGFNFPWKNFDRLAEVTAAAGWAYLICSNNATDSDLARWRVANPHTYVVKGFQSTMTLVSYLAGCDATCFAYECANSGTSGAIRLGLAARKPVIAFEGCRQFRDLFQTTYRGCVGWCAGFEELPQMLSHTPIQRCDPGIVALAHRDSWINQGRAYADIFRQVLA